MNVLEQVRLLMKDHLECSGNPEKCSQCIFNDVDITLSTTQNSDLASATSMCRLLEILHQEVVNRYAGVSVDKRSQRLTRQ
jgi:hypothetical protein